MQLQLLHYIESPGSHFPQVFFMIFSKIRNPWNPFPYPERAVTWVSITSLKGYNFAKISLFTWKISFVRHFHKNWKKIFLKYVTSRSVRPAPSPIPAPANLGKIFIFFAARETMYALPHSILYRLDEHYEDLEYFDANQNFSDGFHSDRLARVCHKIAN